MPQSGSPQADEDRLAALQERLARASGAAERLMAQALRATPNPPQPAGSLEGELERLVASLQALVPPELQRQLAEALRDLLLALRALVDWCLEHMERRRAQPPEVRDIPIL